ncbi:E3 ubiquitin-protein ligase rnf8-like [Artemia franciscana]|uniref:E3 ubiquitin-protein ligase rnf8-like n=1 Tax=Artemia franciscana TaxID=6661 RepID=UPI0032DB046A
MKRHIECLDSELSCSICSEPVKLTCLHTFCQTCILQWERNQRDCPMCRAKYTTISRSDSLLVCCIENLIESTCTQDEKLKRAELVAARVELEKQLLPSTSDSGQTRGSRGRNSGQRGRGVPAMQPAHIRVGTMPTTIVQPASPHQVLRVTRMPGQHSWAVTANGRVITVRTTRGGQ